MINWILGLPLVIVLAFVWTAPARAQAGPERRANHVIIIGVDGLSPDGVMTANTPTMRRMMENGSWSLGARGVLPTSSSANWASMLTSVGPAQHGVTSNDWRVGEFFIPSSVIGSGNFFPSIFQVIAEQRPAWGLGSVYHWRGFENLYDPRFVGYNAHGATEAETAALAAAYIKSRRPEFLFVHLDEVDHAGHAYGHGTPQYYAAVAGADAHIAQIIQATIDAGIADETVIIVTSDHGGVGKGHGGLSLAEVEIPWIIYGKGVARGVRLDLPINTYDTPATALWLLGVDIPYAWLGRPVRAALSGEARPQQAYRTSSLYAAPVIEPLGAGNSPSGGLFINQTAQMRINNPSSVGEVRYTMDGSIPTMASPRYVRSVRIARSTIVRATLFVDGQAASIPVSAYFRMLNTRGAERGLRYSAYLLPQGTVRLPDFSTMEPAASGVAYEFSLDGLTLPREFSVAVVFEGFIHIETAGAYNFSLASDDGSKLYINGRTVVDNDGDHGVITASGGIQLEAGRHPIRVEYFNGGGGSWLGAYIEGPGVPRQFIDPNSLTPR